MTCSEFDHLLDRYIDGELNEAQREEVRVHAAQCGECSEKLKAAEELRDILSHMDDDISVPLPAQAAWRKAVREEAKRKKMKSLYAAVGAIAAVCVLTFGISTMMQEKPVEIASVQRVETDGVTEQTSMDGVMAARSMEMARSAEYVERTVNVENVDEALGYLKDIAAEYGAEIEREAQSAQGVNVFLQVPGDGAEDFICAVDAIGKETDQSGYSLDASAAAVGICVMIIAG
jgi:hypothetical protein